jgi:AcrR family transcriptional regulator
MARRSARKTAARSRRAHSPGAHSGRAHSDQGTTPAAAAPLTERDKIIAAFLVLLAESRFEAIGLAEVAGKAGVSLSQLRAEFGSTLAMLAAQVKTTDLAVLAEDFSEMAEEPARERLFDVLMRRLEILAPHREAVRSLLRSARRNPPLALALNVLARRSQRWMLVAAGIPASGPRGALRAQGLAFLFASVLDTWVHDEDSGHARTMAALDRALARGQRFAGFFDDLCAIPSRLCRFRPRRRRRRRDDDYEESEAA